MSRLVPILVWRDHIVQLRVRGHRCVELLQTLLLLQLRFKRGGRLVGEDIDTLSAVQGCSEKFLAEAAAPMDSLPREVSALVVAHSAQPLR